jgi:molybdopterin-guanine dinucleotide biosynthesis protein A
MTTRYDAVVPAGGAARRLGGADKPALTVGGQRLLDRVLAACAGARATVVVGPRRPTVRPVRWTREVPAGGGPLPALAAGLAALPTADAALGAAPAVVLVLAADLPFLTRAATDALLGALDEHDALDGDGAGTGYGAGTGSVPRVAEPRPAEPGPAPARRHEQEWDGVMLVDANGRDQPLAAAYRVEPLRRELALLGAEHGSLTGLPLRLLTGELTLRRIADPTGDASFDCDTWEDVAAARARLGTEPHTEPHAEPHGGPGAQPHRETGGESAG